MISDEKLLSVAIDYYINKKKQEEIAKSLSVSQVQVGKYLKEAQRRNIVSITVNLPLEKDVEDNYKHLFRDIFGLQNLVLVQGSDNSDKSHERVVGRASQYILETLPNTDTRIGFGWGRTIHDIAAKEVFHEKKTNWEYCPTCILEKKMDNEYFDSIQIARLFQQNWGGAIDEQLTERLQLLQKFKSEAMLAECKEHWMSLNYLVAGLGCSSSRYPTPRQSMFSKEVYKEINMKNLVGDILHVFFDLDGRIYETKSNEILIPLEGIKAIPHTIAVASGFPKIESIIGGLRTGLIDTLVTDVQTAKHVIEYLK